MLRGLLKNNKGAVLLVVLFVIILIVGLAYAFTIVAISTYKTAQNEINSQQAVFEAQSTAKIIMEQFLDDTDVFNTPKFVQQIIDSPTKEITGTYTGTNGEKGQFIIGMPDYPIDQTIIHVTVTANVGQSSSSVTAVLKGEPQDVQDPLLDYSLYVTAPRSIHNYNFTNFSAADGGYVLTLYISSDDTNKTFNYSGGTFPQSGTNSRVTISGDLNMNNGYYKAIITCYGSLKVNALTAEEDVFVRDNFISENNSWLKKSIVSYGNSTINGGTIDGSITAGGVVIVNTATIGIKNNYSIQSKSNIQVTNSNIKGRINGQGNSISVTGGNVGNSSSGGGNIYARNDLTLTNTIVYGDVHVKGNLVMNNSTINGNVRVDGDVIMIQSNIGVVGSSIRSLNTKGDLNILGSAASNITGDCRIDGKLDIQARSTSYTHRFGTNAYVNESTKGHLLSIKGHNGAWDGVNSVKLYNVLAPGYIATPHRVVFSNSPTDTHYPSIIGNLRIQDNSNYATSSDGAIDMGGSTINHLWMITPDGSPKTISRINNVTVTNLYGGQLFLLNRFEQLSGGIIDGTYVEFGTTNTVSYISKIYGNVQSTGQVRIRGNAHFYSNSTVKAATGLIVNTPSRSDNVRQGTIHSDNEITLDGPIGNLYLASDTSNFVMGSTGRVNGNLVSASANCITLSSSSTITESLHSSGPIVINGGVVGGNIKTTSTLTINSGSTVGASSTHQIYAGSGVIDNGGAQVQSIYNDDTSLLTINSTVNGYIYTRGNILINTGSAVGGYVRALGTGTSTIKRSVTGNLQVGGALDMWDTAVTSLSVGGNVRAANARFYSTIIDGNLHTTGSGVAAWGSRTIALEASHVRGSLHAQHASGNVRLGGGCTIGYVGGTYTSRTAAWIGGQLNFSAGNIAYGNVYCGSYLTQGVSSVEGTGNTIHGNLYANSSVIINHEVAGGYGVSSYQGIYSNGSVLINDFVGANGTIAYVRGVGSVSITNYAVTGEVFGPANVTLTNAPVGKVHPRDGSNNPTHWVKLVGNSPVAGDVFSNNGFEQSSGSKIGGSLRVNGSSGVTININAAVQGTVFAPESARVVVADSLSYSAGVPRAVGGTLYATSNVTVGNGSSIGGNVVSYNGNIIIGNNSAVLGNVNTDSSAGGSVTIGSSSPVTGGITSRGNISTGTGSSVGGNVYSYIGSVTLAANVGGSVYTPSTYSSSGNSTISGNLRADGTSTHTIDGSVHGNVWVNGPLNIVASSGAAGSRRIGTNTGHTLRCNGALNASAQYDIRGSVNNISGNMTIGHNVGNHVECPNGVVNITGNVGGNLRSWNTTTVGGNIGGNLFVFSDGTKVVKISGNIGTPAVPVATRIKGQFHQYGTVYGSLDIDGGYTPYGITEFPALTIAGDFTLPAEATKLGSIGETTHISGTLTIVDSALTRHIYGEIRCSNLRINYTGGVSTIITNSTITSWPGKDRWSVRFYDDVHVVNNAYVLGATFYHSTGSGPGSTLFVGRHLAARDCNFYARGYTSTATVATNTSYGSFSVGYNVTGTAGASAGQNGSVVTQGVTIFSRTQVKGNAYYLHSVLAGSNTTTAAQKVSHYVGGNLTLDGSRIEGHASNHEADTLTVVNGNCTLIHSSGYSTYVGNTNAVNRNGNYNHKASYEGLYVGGTLTIGASTNVYVDVYAHTINNSGRIQIGGKWNWGT